MLIAWIKNVKLRNGMLAFVNLSFLFFVFYWNSEAFVLLLVFLLAHYLVLKSFAFVKNTSFKNTFVSLVIILDLAFLGYFNYPMLVQKTSLSDLNLFILVGLGFLILRLVHITVQTGKNCLGASLSGLRFLNYLLFFPAYLSGPLTRYDDFVTSFENVQPLTSQKVYFGLERCVTGFFKIQVLAYASGFFSAHQMTDYALLEVNFLRLIASLAGFTLWLYFSFSGVCDIAIGVGQLLGVSLPENFNRPFAAKNIQQFWQRWHISLMDWVSLYLYQPLLISIKMIFPTTPKLSVVISLLISFCLVGLWHGDAVHFLYYGLFHSLGLVSYFMYSANLKSKVLSFESHSRVLACGLQILSWGLTWAFILSGWFFYLGKQEILLQRLRIGLG